MQIYLDIDDVVLNFGPHMAQRFNTRLPKSWSNSKLTKTRLSTLMGEKEFWLTVPTKHKPNFQPSGFVSARSIPKSWTQECLKTHKIPGRSNIYQVGWGQSKIKLLKSLNAEIFIDDKVETFRECNKNGIFCLLMDAHHNQKVKTKLRIDNLDIENIMNLYRKYKKCI